MNANREFLKLAGIALFAIIGAGAAAACSSDDNAAPSQTTLGDGAATDSTTPGDETGSSGSSSGSTSGSSSGSGSSGSTSDAGGDGGALCDPTATIGGSNSYNTCSSFGCAGKYDNAAHKVPNPLPTL